MTLAPLLRCIVGTTLIVVFTLAGAAETLAPAPALSPKAVVEAQLSALREDSPQGLMRAFQFASPANRSLTGPVERFSAMIRDSYPELLGHRSAIYGETLIKEDEAAQAVEIIARDGQVYRYVFVMSRQTTGDYLGCWMTDSVVNTAAAGDTAI